MMAQSTTKRPSIKDEDTYEALRRRGASKEKAARIANSSDASARKGGHSSPYEDWSKSRLYNRAQELEIEGRSYMNKSELIEALRNR